MAKALAGGAYIGLIINLNELGYPVEQRLGSAHIRHSTDSADLSAMESMTCGPFDGVIVITFVCVGQTTDVCRCCTTIAITLRWHKAIVYQYSFVFN